MKQYDPIAVLGGFALLSAGSFMLSFILLDAGLLYSLALSSVVFLLGLIISFFIVREQNMRMREFLEMVDELLGGLPHKEIESFSASNHGERYKKVLKEFKVGDD